MGIEAINKLLVWCSKGKKQRHKLVPAIMEVCMRVCVCVCVRYRVCAASSEGMAVVA